MIRAVFFDFYNTLGKFDPPRDELQFKACDEFGVKVTTIGIARGYDLADAYMASEIARLPIRMRDPEAIDNFFAEYQRLILEGAGVKVSSDLALKIISRLRQFQYDFALYDDVIPALKVLKKHGIILAMLSNNEGDINNLCNKLGLFPYLDFAINAVEVGYVKPYPPIFLAALKKAHVKPAETVYIGDQYEADVIGARGVGIYPVLLDRDRLKTDVQDCLRIESLVNIIDLVRKISKTTS